MNLALVDMVFYIHIRSWVKRYYLPLFPASTCAPRVNQAIYVRTSYIVTPFYVLNCPFPVIRQFLYSPPLPFSNIILLLEMLETATAFVHKVPTMSCLEAESSIIRILNNCELFPVLNMTHYYSLLFGAVRNLLWADLRATFFPEKLSGLWVLVVTIELLI